MWCHEGGFLLIWLEHRNLMVPGESVYEREHPVSGSGVNYLIYSGQWEVILWASVIQVSVIDIDSPFSSLFWDHYHVRKPVRILYFPDKPDC